MKILEAITRVDALKPNAYSQSDKVGWLSTLDGTVKKEIIDLHVGGGGAFSGYDPDTDLQTELLIPFPYDDIYIKWLEAQIDYYNGEYGKYNNSITMFNTLLEGFSAAYRREHRTQSFGNFKNW